MESSKIIGLIILAVIYVAGNAKGNTCPVQYARFSADHSFCKPPNPTCSIVKEGVEKEDKKIILQVHNEFRSKVASGKESRGGGLPTASNMLQMTWDTKLASVAQKWAAQCIFKHDCDECRSVENFGTGQNLANEDIPGCSSKDCIQKETKPNWKSMITLFYDEVSLFNKKNINPYHFEKGYGHFSQVAWAKSWRVGCGYVVFKKDDGLRRLYACNYGPSGNFKDAPMYDVGKPCSACPSNTCCGNCKTQGPTYAALCSVRNLSLGPVYETRKDALLDCNWRDENSPCKVNKIHHGKRDWKWKPSLSGAYQTIRLKGGESSVLELMTPIQPKDKSFCVVILFRKGPINAAEKDTGSLTLALKIPEWNWSTDMSLQAFGKDFMPYPIDLQWNQKTEMVLKLSVPPNAPEHIFDIKEIIAYDGKCA